MKRSKQKISKQQELPRRDFLKTAAVAGTVVGSGVVSAQAISDVVATEEPKSVKTSYQETDHVREYYKSARF